MPSKHVSLSLLSVYRSYSQSEGLKSTSQLSQLTFTPALIVYLISTPIGFVAKHLPRVYAFGLSRLRVVLIIIVTGIGMTLECHCNGPGLEGATLW